MFYKYGPYISVAERKQKAEMRAKKMKKEQGEIRPIIIEGRTLVKNFWGKAWNKNIESYKDYENRLPRGRSYVRNNAILDLKIKECRIEAKVSGSQIYRVEITINPLKKEKWQKLIQECVGQIDSLIELIQGRFSKNLMEHMTNQENGLFPHPNEIKLKCSCPDWAVMCKHVAATLYGVGVRLDEEPETLFLLRGVDPLELMAHAAESSSTHDNLGAVEEDLEALFGIQMDDTAKESTKKAATKALPKNLDQKQSVMTKTTSTKTLEAPKKRGRPRKELISEPVTAKTTAAKTLEAPKKRGRPRKELISEPVTAKTTAAKTLEAPKKRGRPRKEVASDVIASPSGRISDSKEESSS